MHYLRIRRVTVPALLCLDLVSASPIAAQSHGQGVGRKTNPPGLGDGNGPDNGGGNSKLGIFNNPNIPQTADLSGSPYSAAVPLAQPVTR